MDIPWRRVAAPPRARRDLSTHPQVQWTATFDDAALAALGEACGGVRCVDALGTSVTVDALATFLRNKVHSDELGPMPTRRLEHFDARYTAGPREKLDALPRAWAAAGVVVVV